MPDDVLLKEIRIGQKEALQTLYSRYREDFIRKLVRNYGCDIDQAKEVYQVAIIIVYENILTGKLTTLNNENSLGAYLFQTGVFKYKEWRRKQIKIADFPENYFLTTEPQGEEEERKEKEALHLQQMNIMQKALTELGEPCSSILEMFYYENKSMTEIAEELSYNNTDTTKNMKYKCLKRLQQSFRKRTKNNLDDF